MKINLKPSVLKVAVLIAASLLLVYLASAFFCSSPPCFTKKNEFLLTMFMSEHSWFFIGLWVLFFGGVYILWSWLRGKK